ncbi:uncharacterized protein HaLaN_09230, partial [Haematococcus lacustris]
VLRLDAAGRTRKFFVRRRDLLREYRMQPRDLRRIDPTIDFTKTSPSITIKENVLLLCLGGVSHTEYMARFYAKDRRTGLRAPPFELEVLEGALIVATGRLDAEMVAVTRRVGELLSLLPGDINPVSLEELRRVKGALVELENKADTLSKVGSNGEGLVPMAAMEKAMVLSQASLR